VKISVIKGFDHDRMLWVLNIRIDESVIKKLFGSKNYSRGFQYWRENRVRVCYKVMRSLYGIVEGRRIYRVRANMKNLRDNACSCPLGGNCKHVVAVLIAYNSGEFIDVDALVDKFMRMPSKDRRKILVKLFVSKPIALRVFARLMEYRKHRSRVEVIIDRALRLCQSDLSYRYPERYVDRMYGLVERLERMKIGEEFFEKLIELYICVMRESIGYGYDNVKYMMSLIMEKILDEEKVRRLVIRVIDYVLDNYEPGEEGGSNIELEDLLKETLKLASKYNLIDFIISETERKVKLFRTNRIIEAGGFIKNILRTMKTEKFYGRAYKG